MDWTIEVIQVPVTNIDASKKFYADQIGFHVDFDMEMGPGFRLVQLTPPGSACSIVLGAAEAAPGSLKGNQIVVSDLKAARAELIERGVDVSEINVMDENDGGSFAYFSDPDDNMWALQEIRSRAKE